MKVFKKTRSHSHVKTKQVTNFLGELVPKSALPEFFLVGSYVIGRYLYNADFSYPSEIILNLVMLALLVSIVFYPLKRLLRRFGLLAAHIASLLVCYPLYSYSSAYPALKQFISDFLPWSTQFSSALVFISALCLFFSFFGILVVTLIRKYLPDAETPILNILVFTVGFIFVSQAFKMTVQVWNFRHELSYKQPTLKLKQDKSKTIAKPNIYYLVFDRYANKDTLQKVYSYDNSPTLNFLNDNGFYNRDSALSNYPFTMQSIGSTLRMGYHTDLSAQFKNSNPKFQAGFPYRSFLDNPPAINELKKNGYSYNMVSSWWDFTRKSPSADSEPSQTYRLKVLGKSFWTSDLQRDIMNKSVLSPLLLKGLSIGNKTIIRYELDRNFQQVFYAQLESLQEIIKTSQKSKQPQVTFAHILLPHDPYLFMPDGSSVKYSGDRNDEGADEYEKYRNQIAFANSQLQKIVSQIRHQDPNAVIMLQTDEGPYPKEFRGTQTAKKYFTPLMLSDETMPRKFGSLASYYLPGVSKEEAAANITSHVNAFRFVLSHYLGYDLPNLPDCHFAVGAKFNLFGFKDVTQKIDPASTANCQAYR